MAAVMRAKVGDHITLFDGLGAEFEAEIAVLHKHAVELTIVERREVSRELAFALTLAVALPKGERQKWLVEKATELGVTRIVPLVTERGVAQPVEAALDRLRRTVVEASKQCGRNRLLQIAPPEPVAQFVSRQHPDTVRWLGDPGGEQPSLAVSPSLGGMIAAIGPEGGFASAEVSAALAAGWQCVSIGRSILRVETAAIAFAAVAAAITANQKL